MLSDRMIVTTFRGDGPQVLQLIHSALLVFGTPSRDQFAGGGGAHAGTRVREVANFDAQIPIARQLLAIVFVSVHLLVHTSAEAAIHIGEYINHRFGFALGSKG